MRRTIPWAVCAPILLASPTLAADKVDLVHVHKAERRLELIADGKVVRSYGIAHRSIHISYPSADGLAAAMARTVDAGGMIMIHGQPNGFGRWGWLLQLVDWTDGCIAVRDSDMDEIWAMVAAGTPIEIEQ
ncbi:L,D-transpeptidase family protein [Mesorhizobium intechi]|uniref:L,D-transpeptidase family protein n=1 Tax=Mesorhizobium intechi TaxID=537601 RepID=UPI000CAF22BC|nr:L,D-transpeptidase family protein [Mesorhizobium intechi]TSE13382.1 L,D-transpeptidase family protein [Mesorhizobium intechi]